MNSYIAIPTHIQFAIDRLKGAGYPVYIVGGAVRDFLLGLTPHDFDLATSASEEEIQELFHDCHFTNKNGLKHNTVSILVKKEMIEITSFRHTPFEEANIDNDLRHRDLTINAMAYDGEIYDPLGGKKDIEEKRISMGDDPQRIIVEDPLRILRALRFHVMLGFSIESETKKAMKSLAPLLRQVAEERILNELKTILIADDILDILLEYHEVFCAIFPDLAPTVYFDQHTHWHAHDLYEHIAHVVANVSPKFTLRLAALLHDNGKIKTISAERKDDGGYCYHFPKHPHVSFLMAEPELMRYHVPLLEANQILFLIRNHDNTIATSTKSVKKILARCSDCKGAEPLPLLKDLLELQCADHADHTILVEVPSEKIMEIAEIIVASRDAFALRDLDIDGNVMKNLGLEGKQIGEALHYALDGVIEERVENKRPLLVQYVKEKFGLE